MQVDAKRSGGLYHPQELPTQTRSINKIHIGLVNISCGLARSSTKMICFSLIPVAGSLLQSSSRTALISRVMRQPSIVSHRSSGDLAELKSWFFETTDSKKDQLRAIGRVRALATRGKISHGLESTALLTSVRLQDTERAPDADVLRLSYAMALIRFVNGLLDPLQQSNYAIPLHTLAKTLNLPSFFVELRHMGTHEQLPSLHMLRIASNRALQWLFDNYWCAIHAKPVSTTSQIAPESTQKTEIAAHLKTYRAIRKQNLDLVYKYGNTSETGIKYWTSLKTLKMADQKLLATVFVQSLFKKSKPVNAQFIKLYKPFLGEIGLDRDVEILLACVADNIPEEPAASFMRSLIEIMVDNCTKEQKLVISKRIAAASANLPPQQQVRLLSAREAAFESSSLPLDFLQQLRDETAKSQRMVDMSKYAVASIEDILGSKDEMPAPKKQKTTVRLFEPIPEWQPTPFGVSK